jgi:DNA polymerase I-like protein with 3'-5' exonuclease and polymerase domains
MWDLYRTMWVPLGEVLTTMERRGVGVDKAHLERAQVWL